MATRTSPFIITALFVLTNYGHGLEYLYTTSAKDSESLVPLISILMVLGGLGGMIATLIALLRTNRDKEKTYSHGSIVVKEGRRSRAASQSGAAD
jgi:hypothetical protein